MQVCVCALCVCVCVCVEVVRGLRRDGTKQGGVVALRRALQGARLKLLRFLLVDLQIW